MMRKGGQFRRARSSRFRDSRDNAVGGARGDTKNIDHRTAEAAEAFFVQARRRDRRRPRRFRADAKPLGT